MRIGNLNVAGIARSNFEPGVNIYERSAILLNSATIDVVNVCGGVYVSVVALRGGAGEKQACVRDGAGEKQACVAAARGRYSRARSRPHVCQALHSVQDLGQAQRGRQLRWPLIAHVSEASSQNRHHENQERHWK